MGMKLGAFPFSIRQLQYAVAVADERNFRAAAERCLVSQPSLSAQLQELEAALGVRLFERDRRGVLLTGAGEVLVERARRILLDFEGLRAAARELVDPLCGTLRVGVIPTIAPYLLPALDPALREAFPQLEPMWREDKTENVIAALGNGNLDAGLVALESEIGDVDYEIVGVDLFVVATPIDHRLARSRRPLRTGELDGEDVLLLDDGHCFRDQALELCASAGTRELGFRATSLATLTQMVSGGAGITLLPGLAVPLEGRGKKLAIRNFAKPAPRRTVVLVWRRGSALAESLRRIASVARAAFPGAGAGKAVRRKPTPKPARRGR